MKKRRLAGIVLCGALMSGTVSFPVLAAPPDPAYISKVVVPGDVDSDGSFELLDIIRMQKYLHGQSDMNRQGFYNTDMNGDGCTDIFDMALMKKRLLDKPEGFTRQLDLLPYQQEFWEKANGTFSSAIITSVEELEAYFEPQEVFTTSGEFAYVYMIPTEEVERYLKMYDEAFFEENILCLNAINQTCGDGLMYEITGFERDENGHLHIRYADTYDQFQAYPDVENGVLAQVVIPKSLDAPYGTECGQFGVEWDYDGQTEAFTPSVTSELTNAVTDLAWYAALSGKGTAVITSPAELNVYASENFRNAVCRSLESTYDAAFFEENVLILDLYGQLGGWQDDWETVVSDVSRTEEGIVLTYDRMYIDGYVNSGVLFTQVTIPKSQYHGETILTKNLWETPVTASFSRYDIGILEEVMQEQLSTTFHKEGAWITSYAELEAYVNDCFNEAGMEAMGNGILSNAEGKFADKAVYIWMDSDVIGSSESMKNCYVADGRLVLTMKSYQPISCEGGSFLNMLWTDQEYAGMKVSTRTLSNYGQYVSGDGDIIYYDVPQNYGGYSNAALVVNQYTFHDEAQIDFYWVPWGGGSVQYGTPEWIASVAVSSGAAPFTEAYTVTDTDSVCYSGEQFEMTWNEDNVTVSYRTTSDGEWQFVELPYKIVLPPPTE